MYFLWYYRAATYVSEAISFVSDTSSIVAVGKYKAFFVHQLCKLVLKYRAGHAHLVDYLKVPFLYSFDSRDTTHRHVKP